jgi:hypothetical protein
MQPKPMGQQWGDFEMLNGLDSGWGCTKAVI